MAEDMSKNLNDLANAAKAKLAMQRQPKAAPTQDDIYAELRDEAAATESYNFQNPYVSQPTTTPNFEYQEENPVEIREGDDVLFEGGPSLSQVELWKKEYGEGRVLHTKIVERHFIFRTLHRYEYKQIVAIENIDPLHREEIICNTVTLWPNKYDFKMMAADDGGYPSTLAQIIMENSGFTKEYGIEVL